MTAKVTTATIRKMKSNEKISMLTAYDCPTARIADKAGVDMLLVGDTLGMVVLGLPDTTGVTIQDMIHHTKAVSRGAENAMVVADMPFLSMHTGKYDAVKNAGALIAEGGAQAVKVEGGIEIMESVKAILDAGIPIVGHLGLQPQSINKYGGFFKQGKSEQESEKLLNDAIELEKAGVFAIVLECIPAPLAQYVTKELSIPTIGIGAGSGCDGQVLVIHDMLGMYDKFVPPFVKQYANIGEAMGKAIKSYVTEVKEGIFPK